MAMERLREETAEETTREVCDLSIEELARLDRTVRALLVLTRPPVPRPKAVDVVAWLAELARQLRPDLLKRQVVLDLDTASLEPFGEATRSFLLDETFLREALVPLVDNAAEAILGEAGRTGGCVVLRASVVPGQGDLVLAVEDDGPGIPEKDHGRVFEPFFTTKLTGIGLGLPLAESLVARHGGRIELRSAPGAGSVFSVLLEGSGKGRPTAAT